MIMIGSFPHKILAKILAYEARRILRLHKPIVVGITGSFGKSSAKEAIAAVLSRSGKSVRKTPKNENTELGVPKTIIGSRAGAGLFSWVKILCRGASLCLNYRTNIEAYPQILVLEMAAEYPGDIDYLVKLAPPKIGVLTGIGPAHSEFLGSPEKILAEKSLLITELPKDGVAVLNADDNLVISLVEKTKARVITFSVHNQADVHATDFVLMRTGFHAKISWHGQTVPILIEGVVGLPHLYACLAGVAVGLALGMKFEDAVSGLRDYQSLPGRMRLIPGVKGSTIIDDSYNANPEAVKRALEVLLNFPSDPVAKRYAVLGDMRELGKQSAEYHEEVGRTIADMKIDFFIGVGALMREAFAAARKNGMDESHLFHFATSYEAGEFVKDKTRSGDIILIKGSQNQIRMERAVYALMAEPDRAAELLVRQGPEWVKKD